MAITSAVADLFKSFYELLSSIFGTAYAIVASVVNAVLGFVTGIVNLCGDVLGGLVGVAGGVGKFVAANFVLLAIGALAMFAFVRFTTSGRQVAAGKKTN